MWRLRKIADWALLALLFIVTLLLWPLVIIVEAFYDDGDNYYHRL